MIVRAKKLRLQARLPEYKTKGAACADLYAAERTVLYPGRTCAIQTGIAIELPPGWYAEVRPRSGLALAQCEVTLGTIDNDYRGEIGVIMSNRSLHTRVFESGDRVAQLLCAPDWRYPCDRIGFKWVEELSETERGAAGFGSTGS